MCSKKCTTVEMLAIRTIVDGSGGVNPFYSPEHVKSLCQMRVINEIDVLGGVVWSSPSRGESG